MTDLRLPAGKAADGPDPLFISPEAAGWSYAGLRVIELSPGEERIFVTGGDEMAVLPMAGGCVVECEGYRFDLHGRENVFARVSDFAYVPIHSELRIVSIGGGRFALPSARATRRLDPAYGPAEEVPVEIRGAGQASRQINNFLEPEAFPADRLIAVEVLTPEGNWSSYPPHKHDEHGSDEESLEEIYYFEIARLPDRRRPEREMGAGFGLHRLYTGDGKIDLTETVAHGDAVLIPRGYHGPSVAPPGYDMYYLNVLAGPEERRMAVRDDPDHHWVRDTWRAQPRDERLPMVTAEEQGSERAGNLGRPP
ncbi:MAG: 5-deoxy-glucuronate isomerase [Actinomycetota bacterium]|nr:5-deoxy-glucuronate isomerase [Actinomycetota bacterium]